MEKNNIEILLGYLKNILSDVKTHQTDADELEEGLRILRELKEQEELLRQEALEACERAELVKGYNDLLTELTRKRHEWILVIDARSRDIMYCNKREGKEEEENPSSDFCKDCKKRLSFRSQLLGWQDHEEGKVWEVEEEDGKAYRITTFPIIWKNRDAYAHIVLDITADKENSRRLRAKAYRDPGTGIYNRLYFEEYMSRFLEESGKAILCYMDLDGLKYVNDHYGHLEGDEYIRSFVDIVGKQFRDLDVFARIGGDEFCAVLPMCPEDIVREKMEEGLEEFLASHKKEYPASFSYGIVEVDPEKNRWSMMEILERADASMYECKKKNKAKYHNRA